MKKEEAAGKDKSSVKGEEGTSSEKSRASPPNQEKKDATKTSAPTTIGDRAPIQHPTTTGPSSAVVASSPRLYVGNLHPRVTQVHLESLLSARSLAVLQIQFIPPTSGGGGGGAFCFVTLPSVADATRAIQLLHNRKLLGRSLVVQPAHQQTSKAERRNMGHRSSSNPSASGKKEERQLDDQIQAIRAKLKEKDG